MSERRGNQEARRADFKFAGMTTEELRRRREQNQVEIRKNKREDSLNKRRNLAEVSGSTPTGAAGPSVMSPPPPAPADGPEFLQKLSNLSQTLYSPDLNARFRAVRDFRKMLSREQNPPIDQVIECGVVPRMVEILGGRDLPALNTEETHKLAQQLQFEAAWVLTNIASGTSDHTRLVVESGAFQLFVELLKHPNPELRGQCIWAIGNISGESPEFRDLTLQCDVMGSLLTTLVSEMNAGFPTDDLAKNTTWAISNLCRGKPSPAWDQIALALPVLAQLIYLDHEEILGEATWAIAYMSDGSSRALEEIIRAGIIPRLVALLSSRSFLIQASCVRALGNIVTGDDSQTQAVIDAGALTAFGRLFSSTSKSILRETCWAISNITAGTAEQIKAVIDANLIPPVIRLLSVEFLSVKREACWAICNATSVFQTHPEVIKYLVNQGCIKPLCDVLAVKDMRIIMVALDGLDNILEVGQQEAMNADDHMNPYALHVEEAQGLETISALQQHSNMSVYLKAKALIDKYFGDDDFDELIDDQAFEFSQTMSVPQGGFDFS